jgi:putative autotransporter adhesin-like protein
MRKSAAAAAIIVASAVLAGCARGHSESAGPTVSRNYEVGNFQQIEVAGPYDVDVRTGAKPGVSAQGSQHLLERTTVEVQGSTLVIRTEKQNGFHFGWSSGKVHFVVTVPQLSSATMAGSGDLKVDHVRGDSFEGSLAGSGDLELASVQVKSLKLSLSGSGDVKAGSGQAQSADYQIAGSGDVDAGAIATQQLNVSIAGSGDVKAHSSGTANIEIVGSGDVDVTGGAKCTISKHGSGDVHCS